VKAQRSSNADSSVRELFLNGVAKANTDTTKAVRVALCSHGLFFAKLVWTLLDTSV